MNSGCKDCRHEFAGECYTGKFKAGEECCDRIHRLCKAGIIDNGLFFVLFELIKFCMTIEDYCKYR